MSTYRVNRIWHYEFRFGGRRYKGSTFQTTRGKAKMVEAKKREEVRSQLLAPKVCDISFRALADEYLDLHVSQKKAKNYFHQRIRVLLRAFGSRNLSQIGPKEVTRFQVERAKVVSPATVNRDLAVMKGMFTKASEWGYAVENPVKRVKFLRETGRRERFLSREEADTLLKACSDWLRPLVTVALHTGMRRGELLGLAWRDVDFRTGYLHLDAGDTKSGYGRKVPMNQTVRGRLELLRADGPVRGLDVRVFAGPDGGDPLSTLRREYPRAVRMAKLSGFRFHDLRHSCASFLVQAGVPLNTVRDLLGHRSLAMTLRYAHLAPSDRHDAVALLDHVR